MTGFIPQCVNDCSNTAGLTYGSSAPEKLKIANTTFFSVNGRKMYVTTQEVSIVGAKRNLPTLNGTAQTAGNLVSDDGTVDASTKSCRIYALVATSAQTEAGTVTLSVIAGEDFPKHRQAVADDFPIPADPNSVVIGWMYLKNESGSDFVPGTSSLGTVSNTTKTFTDNYAQIGF
ncbi:MAG: hypothetical protein WCO07_01410 [bacterium]